MYKKLLPIALLFSSSIYSQTVKDTLWVGSYDEITTKALATSFKISKPANDKKGLDEIITYNKTTKAIENRGIGKIKPDNTISYDGKVTHYNEDGSENFNMYFELENVTKIISTDPFTKEEYTLTYENTYPYNGTMVQLYKNCYLYVEVIDGTYQSYVYINKNNPKQKYMYAFDENANILNEQYFDANGELLYTADYESGSIVNGTSIVLNYDTFKPDLASVYVNGINTETIYYFTSGEIKSKMIATDLESTTFFYDTKGNQIASYHIDHDQYGTESNQEGIYIYYNHSQNPDIPTSQSEYKKGELVKETTFYTETNSSIPKSIKYYANSYYLNKIEYFNTDGSKKGEITYNEDGYSPANGILYEDDSISTYQNGILTNKKVYYSTGKLFEDNKDNRSTYYDIKGNIIGKLTFTKSIYETIEPFDGTFYSIINDQINSKIVYNKGNIEYTATYESSAADESKLILREENFSPLSGTHKRIVYTRQGKKNREELIAKRDYDQTVFKVTYFDSKGNVTGTFDNIEKEGIYYTFFDNDLVESASTYKKGELIYKKEYINKNGYFSTVITPYLASEINYYKEGIFYDVEGKQIAKASYKDGKPYTGTVSTYDGYTTTISTYEKGMKNGVETSKSDYSDSFDTKTYYQANEITKEETYNAGALQSSKSFLNGQLDGPSDFYDTDGELIGTLQFKNGIADHGTSVAYGYENIIYSTYENGDITYEKSVNVETEALIYENKLTANGTMQKSIFNENGELLYQFETLDDYLNGTCIYYENGKAKYKSKFENGKFIEGTVALKALNTTDNYYDYDNSIYFICTITKNTMIIKKLSTDSDEVIFELSSKLKKGKMIDNPIFMNQIDSNFLYPYTEISYYY